MSYKPLVKKIPEGGTGLANIPTGDFLAGNGTSALQVVASPTGTIATGVTNGLPVFSANPSVTSLTLSNDVALTTYVQGTWTPILQFAASSTGITYSTQLGEYTQIGNMVFFTVQIVLTSKGSASGNAHISLPVNNFNNDFNSAIGYYANLTLAANNTNVGYQISTANNNIVPYSSATNGGGITVLSNTAFANNTALTITGAYTVS